MYLLCIRVGSADATLVARDAPDVSTGRVDDVTMGSEAARRESVTLKPSASMKFGNRNTRIAVRTSREIEENVLTGHESFRSWCATCVEGRGGAERHRGEGHKELEDGSKKKGLVVGSQFPMLSNVDTVGSW